MDHRIHIETQPAHHQNDTSASEESSYTSTSSASSSASPSEAGEPVDTELLYVKIFRENRGIKYYSFRSDAPRTTHTEELVDSDDSEHFTWPLDPQLPLTSRKQLLIAHMRK